MKLVVKLLKGSAIQVFRDQMLLMLCFAPFFTGIALSLVIPLANKLLIQYLYFTITPYYLMADAVILTMGAIMIGMMVGLLMLDERDDGIFSYYSVTPVGGNSYLAMRLSLPLFYSFFVTIITISYTSLSGLAYGWMIAPSLLSAYNGTFFTMLLFCIASNKVEGLAISKLLGIIILGIPLAWFANSYLRIIGYLLPPYWIMDMLIQAEKGDLLKYVTDFILGTGCTTAWIIVLYGVLKKKIG